MALALRMRDGSTAKPVGRHRTVPPYALAQAEGSWYLVAYCELSEEVRIFRIDDDGSLTVTHRVADPHWIVRHVLQYGPDAEVLEPEEVRGWVRESAKRGLNSKGDHA